MSRNRPEEFLKCPECHRKTVTMSMHLDGDVGLRCDTCGEQSTAFPLNQNVREYSSPAVERDVEGTGWISNLLNLFK